VREFIEFVLNDEIKRLDAFDPTLTVLRYLRETERLTGSKEGCAEGDCGACTGVMADLDGETVRYSAVNTCIQFVGMLDGKALLTVEYLKRNGELHPVQEAMIDSHGSQCGFCTPGFVMSLFAGYQQRIEPDRLQTNDLLAGNLCRCTGYTAIINAAERALGRVTSDTSGAAQERQLIDQLKSVRRDDGARVALGDRRFIAPGNLDELVQALDQYPDAVLVAGATDVGLFVTKHHRPIDTLIHVGKIVELNALSREGNALRLGAALTYQRARPALAELYPALDELIRRIGAVQVRSLGTIGGNIANASPIGDMPPALIAAGSTLRLRRRGEIRDIPLEDYFIAYGRQDRRRSEFVESVLVPEPKPGTVFKIYKISKRFDQDISSVCGAFSLAFERNDGALTVASARICFGGMAGTPSRARKTEAFLIGKPWNEATTTKAMAVLKTDYRPISDWRASARYRIEVAANLLRRCYLETVGGNDLQLARREANHAR
jgi:xanthine dehydrogenase small subunit